MRNPWQGSLATRLISYVACGWLLGCSSMTTPVLRHETGEVSIPGHGRGGVTMETSRAYAFAPVTGSAGGLLQSTSVFSTGHLGVFGTIGVFNHFEANLRAVFNLGGSGWRFGGKYQLIQSGPFAVAALVGYGRYAGSGTVSLAGLGGQENSKQTLAAQQVDLGVPLSYRFGPSAAVYTGLNYYSTQVSGSAETTAVSRGESGFGVNLGLRYSYANLDFDGELAAVKGDDTIAGGTNTLLMFGLGVGVRF